MRRVSHGPDRLRVGFDDPALVANAGLILVATLTARLGLEALVAATVRLGPLPVFGDLCASGPGGPRR